MKHYLIVTIALSLSLITACTADDDQELKNGAKSNAESEGGGFGCSPNDDEEAETEPELFTNSYVVPPSFQKQFLHVYDNEPTGASPGDPFADPSPEKKSQRMTAKQVLESAGITFGPGASVIYGLPSSQIIVRNTQDQLELVEAYFDQLVYSMETGIRIHLDIFEAPSLELKASRRKITRLKTTPTLLSKVSNTAARTRLNTSTARPLKCTWEKKRLSIRATN